VEGASRESLQDPSVLRDIKDSIAASLSSVGTVSSSDIGILSVAPAVLQPSPSPSPSSIVRRELAAVRAERYC
jgi:hypothetical protein